MILNLSLNIHYESDTTIMTNNAYFKVNLASFSLILMQTNLRKPLVYINPQYQKLMNKILSGIFTLFVIATVGEIHAQTFRTFQTTTQEITYTNRTLADGSVVVETVVETVVVDLTPNPVTAESTVSTDTKEETLFLTQAAATALQTAIASAESSASASDTVIAETVAAEVESAVPASCSLHPDAETTSCPFPSIISSSFPLF